MPLPVPAPVPARDPSPEPEPEPESAPRLYVHSSAPSSARSPSSAPVVPASLGPASRAAPSRVGSTSMQPGARSASLVITATVNSLFRMDRPAQLAGRWYPRDPGACRDAVGRYGADAEPKVATQRGLLAPHAGWAFSGDCAGRGYRWLAAAHPSPSVVVLFGSHRGPEGPNTAFVGDGWETPLGRIPTHPLAETLAAELSLDEEPVQPLRPDNAVELHLPFVAHHFPGTPMIMMGIAMAKVALEIGRHVGGRLREAGEDPVFVGSTDLTHYGPNYAFAPRGRGPDAVEWVRSQNDRGFLDAVLGADAEMALSHGVEHRSACCPGAAVATMEAVRAFEGGLAPVLVDHYLSFDVRPDESFVGYASLVL